MRKERKFIAREREGSVFVQRPLYTRTNLQSIIPPHFWSICQQRIFFSSLYKRFSYDIYWRIACFISISNFFCICYKKHLKWGDEVSIREFLRLCSALWFVWVREREREERERERASSFYKSSIWVRGQQASISLFWNVCINFLPRNGVSNWKQKLFLLLLFRGDNLKNRFRTNFWKSWSHFGANLRSENF